MVGVAGNPELIQALREARNLARLLRLDSVRQDQEASQMLLHQLYSVCALLMRNAREGALVRLAAHQSSSGFCMSNRSKVCRCPT